MTDKVRKIKDWINKTQEGLMDAQGNFEYPEHQGAYDVLCNLEAYIDSLEESVSKEDFEMALAEMVDEAQRCIVEPWVIAAQWKDELIKLAKSEEPVSEELEEAINAYIGYSPEVDECSSVYGKRQAFRAGAKWQKTKDEPTTEDLGEYINELSKQFPEVSFAKLSRIAVRVAKWKEEQMMAKAVETTFNVSLPSGLYDKLWIKGCKGGDKLLVIKKDEL